MIDITKVVNRISHLTNLVSERKDLLAKLEIIDTKKRTYHRYFELYVNSRQIDIYPTEVKDLIIETLIIHYKDRLAEIDKQLSAISI